MRPIRLAVLPAAALALAACAGARPRPAPAAPEVLAEVNERAFTVAELRSAFTDRHGGHQTFLAGEVEIRKFLDKLVDRWLLLQEAYRIGLDQQPDIRAAAEDAAARHGVKALVAAEVEAAAAPTEDEVKAIWESRLEDRVQVRQIVVRTEAEARDVHARLGAGAEFEALARERSISPSAKYGGRVSPLGWGAMEERWEEVAFALGEKERSAPFETAAGWEVLEVEARTRVERPPLEKAAEKIRAVLKARKVRAREQAVVAELKARWKATVADPEPDLRPAALRAARDAGSSSPAATWEGGALALGAFAARVDLDALAREPEAEAVVIARRMLDEALVDALLRREAAERGLDRAPGAVEAATRRREELIENRLYGEYVLTGIAATDEEVRARYEASRATLVTPEKRRLAHIVAETEEQARALLARLRDGEPFAQLARSESRDPDTRKMGGDLGLVQRDQAPPGFEAVFAVGEGELAGPIQSKFGWHVFRVTQIVPSRPRALEEVEEELRAKLLQEKRSARRADWVAQLRATARIVVHDAAVKRLAAEAEAAADKEAPPASPAAHGAAGP